jgi:hypothetical protein
MADQSLSTRLITDYQPIFHPVDVLHPQIRAWVFVHILGVEDDQAFAILASSAYSGRCGQVIPFDVGTGFCLMWAAIPL